MDRYSHWMDTEEGEILQAVTSFKSKKKLKNVAFDDIKQKKPLNKGFLVYW